MTHRQEHCCRARVQVVPVLAAATFARGVKEEAIKKNYCVGTLSGNVFTLDADSPALAHR